MLGFEDALCGVDSGYFGHASYLTPTLMNEVNCDGDESALDFCYFGGWDAPYSYSFCNSYFDDVGVVCLDG